MESLWRWVQRKHEMLLTIVVAPFGCVLVLIGWAIMVAMIVAAIYLVLPFILGE